MTQIDDREAARLQLEANKVLGCGIVVMTLGAICAITIMMLAFLFMLTRTGESHHRPPPPVLTPYP